MKHILQLLSGNVSDCSNSVLIWTQHEEHVGYAYLSGTLVFPFHGPRVPSRGGVLALFERVLLVAAPRALENSPEAKRALYPKLTSKTSNWNRRGWTA